MQDTVQRAVARLVGPAVAEELTAAVYREPASQRLTPYQQSLLARARRVRASHG